MTDTRYAKIGQQTDFSTAAEPTEHLLLVSESIKLRHEDINNIQSARSMGVSRSLSARRTVGGGLDIYQSYAQLKTLLGRTVSDASLVTIAAGVGKSTFIPSPHFEAKPCTLDIARDEAIHRYIGLFAQALRISFGQSDQHFGVSLEMLGKDEDTPQALEVVDGTDFPRPEYIGETGATTPFSIVLSDGSTSWNAYTDSIDMNFKWNRDLRHPARRATPTGIIGGSVVGASAKLKWLYESDTEFLLDAYRTRADLSMLLTMQGDEIGSTGYYEEFTVYFPVCKLLSEPPTLKNSGFGNIDFPINLLPLLGSGISNAPFRFTIQHSIPGGGE